MSSPVDTDEYQCSIGDVVWFGAVLGDDGQKYLSVSELAEGRFYARLDAADVDTLIEWLSARRAEMLTQ